MICVGFRILVWGGLDGEFRKGEGGSGMALRGEVGAIIIYCASVLYKQKESFD